MNLNEQGKAQRTSDCMVDAGINVFKFKLF